MVSKPRTSSTEERILPPQNDTVNSLDGLFASTPGAIKSRERKEKLEKIDDLVRYITEKLTSVLGTCSDYEVVVEELTNPPRRRLFNTFSDRVVPKTTFGRSELIDASIDRLIYSEIRPALIHWDAGISDVKTVVSRVRGQLVDDYQLCYLINEGKITMTDYEKTTPESILLVRQRLPDVVESTRAKLESLIDSRFIKEKIETEIKDLALTEKIIELVKRLQKSKRRAVGEDVVCRRILDRLLIEFDSGAPPEPDPKAVQDDDLDLKRKGKNKLAFREIMVLLSEFMPVFEVADNTKKAAFIVAISPYESAKRIGDEFSDINLFAKEHVELVAHWRKELKSTKRGRPPKNRYKKLQP